MEQLEEFLLMDDVEGGGVLDPSVLIDGTHDDHNTINYTSTLDDQWWINHDDDGFILKEIDDEFLFHYSTDIPSITSILSTEKKHNSSTNIDVTDDHDQQQQQQQQYQSDIRSILSILSIEDDSIDHNHQEAAAAELLFNIDNYYTNTEEDQHNSSTNVVTNEQQPQQQHDVELQQQHEEELQQQQQHETDNQQHAYELEKDDEEEEMMMDQAEIGSDGSKNLVSERNRRKRLNTQFFTLRSIVPNITKMDKRSILVDALAYLQSILQQTEDEMEKINSSTNSVQELPADDHSSSMTSSSLPSSSTVDQNTVMEAPPLPPPYERCAALPAISKIGVEKLDDERFILKIAYNKALGAMGQVQRLVQMLGLDITNISVYEQDEHHMETMNFLRVIKKKGLQVVLTEDDLLHKVQKNAKMLGLLFVSD